MKVWQTQEKVVQRAGNLADLQHSDSAVHTSSKQKRLNLPSQAPARPELNAAGWEGAESLTWYHCACKCCDIGDPSTSTA